MSTLDSSFLRLFASIRITDCLDIAIASLLIYGVLRLLRTSSNRLPLLGAAVVVAVYFIARAMGLFLTEMLLRSASLGLFVVFAVAFQEDIRRAVLRWRHWQPHRALDHGRHLNEVTDPLVDFAFQCAERRIGALIVLQGREMLDGHLNGGIELLAPVKTILMQSIFDPHSPGHDGALVVRDGRIVRICAQLPLSHNIGELKHYGTRHSAGLGLAELTDSYVVIVSEERGSVSVAHDGGIAEVSTPSDLKRGMEWFLDRTSPATRPRSAKRFFRYSSLKLAAVATATLGWFLFARHGDTLERTFVVPIEYRNIPANLCLNEQSPVEVSFTLSGSEPAFGLLVPNSLRVRVDLEGYQAGEVAVQLTERDCVHPAELNVARIEPRVLHLELVRCSGRPGLNRSTSWLKEPRFRPRSATAESPVLSYQIGPDTRP